MDLAAARAVLPVLTREKLGERVTVIPWRSGEMRGGEDVDRERQENVLARFDADPEADGLGGGNRMALGYERTKQASETLTVSFPRAALTATVAVHDRIVRANGETYEVLRKGFVLDTVIMFYIGAVA